MADTLEEALSALNSPTYSEQNKLIINNDLRTITVPDGFIFGVYNDKDVLSVDFEMPRYYDDIDLSEFDIQINYLNAADTGGVYFVEDPAPVVGEEKIEFQWVLGRGVFVLAGTVQFIVCLRKLSGEDDGVVEKEFNTTIARGTVLAGLEVDDPIDPDAYSVLSHIRVLEEICVDSANRTVAAADSIEATIDNCETATAMARALTEEVRTLFDGMVPISEEDIDDMFT